MLKLVFMPQSRQHVLLVKVKPDLFPPPVQANLDPSFTFNSIGGIGISSGTVNFRRVSEDIQKGFRSSE